MACFVSSEPLFPLCCLLLVFAQNARSPKHLYSIVTGYALCMDIFGKKERRDLNRIYHGRFSVCTFAQMLGVNLMSAHFQSIIKDLDCLRKKYLCIEHTARHHIKNINIANELKIKHPYLFNDGELGRRNIFFALQIISRHHSRDRSLVERGKARKCDFDVDHLLNLVGQKPVPVAVEYPNLFDRVLHSKPPLRLRQVLDCVLLPNQGNIRKHISTEFHTLSVIDDGSSSISNVEVATTPYSTSNCFPASGPSLPPLRNDVCSSKMDPILYPEPWLANDPEWLVHPYPDTTAFNGDSGNPIAAASTTTSLPEEIPASSRQSKQSEICLFLGGCKPPMMHFLRCFVDYGCVTNTFLRTIAGWERKERIRTVKEIINKCPGNIKPTDMDVAILLNQFETYFQEN